MRRWIVGLVVILVLTAGAVGVLRRSGTLEPGAQGVEPTPLPPVEASSEVLADAVVVPVRHASLSLPIGGTVGERFVEEGATVEAGDLLLRLDVPQQVAAVAQAEATLAQAQAALAQAEAGLTQAEAAAARAETARDRATAALAKLAAGAREEEVAAARAALAAAQAGRQRVTDGASAEEIEAARANVAIAEAELARVQQGATEEQIIAARTTMEKAQRAVQQAQAAYDQVRDRADVGALPQSLQLEQATLDYEAARAQYEELVAGPDEQDVAVAEARLRQARANLAQVTAGARTADVAAAQAEIDRAQAQLDLLLADARPEDVAMAQSDVAAAESEVASARASVQAAEASVQSAAANVQAAEAGLAQAQAALAEAELRAPFTGTVAFLEVTEGEQVAAGAIAAQVADLSTWQIETDDLTELRIVAVEAGAPAMVTFDALPGVEMPGVVSRIRPIGENKQGDITYTVIVTPDEQDERLRWNMTATVVIQAQK